MTTQIADRPSFMDMPANVGEFPNTEVKAEEHFQHNWLYSVVPISIVTDAYYTESNRLHSEYKLEAYLTGYCRTCNKAFSRGIPNSNDGSYYETDMNIPKFGCVSPLAGL